jgi:hypothetical protein
MLKRWNNKMNDIRHTDQHTIPLNEPNAYKLIANSNFELVELVILASPKKFLNFPNPAIIKKSYSTER